ncbi:MAG TPA: hydantoinase B/oxoprolinase family protein [Variovorax sp.]|nr:hydantoinase B/oxoprolinase family protein [Variovorax sp.]
MKTLDPILTKVLWNRLISIVDEASTGLVRSCYSINLRDYHDYCIGIFDPAGNMLVHSTDTTPGFIGMMPVVMKNFLARYPIETIADGDVLATNDPWLATGHLPDISMAAPIFHEGVLVGFAVCVAHHLDIGGRMACIESRDMYEEGLKIPMVKLYEAGRRNDLVFEFLRANVRVSHQVIGDVNAQLVATSMCAAGLRKMIREYGFQDLSLLASTIMGLAEKSMRRQIRAIPNGVYRNAVRLPPLRAGSTPIDIVVAIEVKDEELVVDYTGSSGEVELAVNMTMPFTIAYTTYPIKVAFDPEVPNNAGCLAPIRVIAPEGSVFNCRPPAPTWGRAMIAHNLPEIIFGALADAIPERMVAASGSTPLHMFYFNGRKRSGEEFLTLTSHMGGFGASAQHDGYSAMSFPYNIASIPIEAVETETCVLYERKGLVPDTAGAGRRRGGFGQEVVITVPDDDHAPLKPIAASIRGTDRSPQSVQPILGRCGGSPGAGAHLSINGQPQPYNAAVKFAPGDVIRLVVPGGGGFGDPFEREPERVRKDVRAGLVTQQSAAQEYGVVLTDALAVDEAATSALRSQRMGAGETPTSRQEPVATA